MSEELQPCPCGNKSTLAYEKKRGGHYWSVFCTKCHNESTPSLDKQETINKWNGYAKKVESKVKESNTINSKELIKSDNIKAKKSIKVMEGFYI